MNREVYTLHRPARAPRRDEVPPLHPGDHLTAEEFERRYDAMPELKKAELIDGVVYMPSPVSQSEHGGPHAQLMGWLVFYAAYTPGVEAGDNSTVRMDKRNRPQSDGMLRILPARGGQSSNSGKYLAGAPELLGEWLRPALPMTSIRSSKSFSATACKSTSFGEYGMKQSTGSICRSASSPGCPLPMVSTRAAFFPVCGWTPKRC
jgi:hypothetical protein